MSSDDAREAVARHGRGEDASSAVVSAGEVEAFQASFLRLLEKRTALYTMGDSSSVPTHVAADLVRSICFVLGIDPETREIPERLLRVDLDAEYRRRLDEIEAEVARAKQQWERAVAEMPLIRNVALRDTLENIGDFFRRYDFRSMAHEIPCDIDYPLAHPVPGDLPGVHYIAEYLRRLLIEIDFLARFDLDATLRVLSAYCPDYRGLLISLYEPVATNALGLVLAGEDPRGLAVSASARDAIAKRLGALTHGQRAVALRKAAGDACDALGVSDPDAVAYLRDFAPELVPRIELGLASGDLSGVFVSAV